MNDQNHQPVSLGSGFVVAPGMVVTNHHVIESSASGSVKLIGQDQNFNINGLLAVDHIRDLALLDVPGLNAPNVTISKAEVAVGEKIYPIGNPLGLEGTLSEGLVSGIRTVGEDEIIQISAPISPGSSGGPVLNEYAELVGVAVATIQGGQNLNFAIPSRYVAELLAGKGESQPLSTEVAEAESILDAMGSQKPTDGIIGENLIWDDKTDILGGFTYSLRNTTSDMIDNVHVLVIFYDKKNNPLDVFSQVYSTSPTYDASIPAGLAKRLHGSVDGSVKKLTTDPAKDNPYLYAMEPSTKVEIRVLNYDIVR